MTLIFAFLLGFTAMLGAASLAGRGMASTVVVAEIAQTDNTTFAYAMIDIGRGSILPRSIQVPDFAGSRFYTDGAYILQVTRADGEAHWTLSKLDPANGALLLEFTLTTASSVRLNMQYSFPHESNRESNRWRIFSPETDEVYYGNGAQGQVLETLNTGNASGVWSPDGTRVAIPEHDGLTIVDVETGKRQQIPLFTGPFDRPRWSPDGRYIMGVAASNLSDWPLAVIDTQTGEVVAQFEGRAGNWCGDRIVYSTENDGILEARITDLSGGENQLILQRDLNEIDESLRAFSIRPLPERTECDWLTGTIVGEESMLLHLESGTQIPLGINTQMIEAVTQDGAFFVRVSSGGNTELRRVILDPTARTYEVVASVRSLSTSLMWIDDSYGALSLGADGLIHIDPSGTQTVLISGSIRSFYVVP